MKIEREFVECDGFKVPCVAIKPYDPKGVVIVVHGYGGSKEGTLGLAWRIAEGGYLAACIDLRGHGEHPLNFDKNCLDDVEAAISYFRDYGDVTVIGHSLGGRLALTSSADYVVGISPALSTNFSKNTQSNVKKSRDYLVRTPEGIDLFDILSSDIPTLRLDQDKVFLIYGTRDLPEIISECENLKSNELEVVKIEDALHSDIFLLQPSFKVILRKLQEWYIN